MPATLANPLMRCSPELTQSLEGQSRPEKVVCHPKELLFISNEEWNQSKLTPDCIVEDYLFSDVGTYSAPGGTGKTTLCLYEYIHIVLGRSLYGLEVRKPGWCPFYNG